MSASRSSTTPPKSKAPSSSRCRRSPSTCRRLQEQARQAPLIVFCHHGVRSLNVVNWLRRQGVENCWSMAGGIDLWSLAIDPGVPRY